VKAPLFFDYMSLSRMGFIVFVARKTTTLKFVLNIPGIGFIVMYIPLL